MKLSQIKNGKTFKIGDTEFIKFSEKNGNVTAVTRNIVFYSNFGNSNKFSESKILEKLKTEWLPKITNIVGEDNIVEFETDLLSLDGSSHDTITSKVSLVTLDFYRQNREIFDDYPAEDWWWLATPGYYSNYCCKVSYGGYVDYIYRVDDGDDGVRPALVFKSSISVSR